MPIGFVSIESMLFSPTICTCSRLARSGGVGVERWKRAVVSSTTSTLFTDATCEANWLAIFGSWTRLIVKATSAAVNGEPSCHVTPLRRLNVTVFPSVETCHDSASLGCTLSVRGSTQVSVSKTAERTEWRNTSRVERCGSSVFGSPGSATVRTPPATARARLRTAARAVV